MYDAFVVASNNKHARHMQFRVPMTKWCHKIATLLRKDASQYVQYIQLHRFNDDVAKADFCLSINEYFFFAVIWTAFKTERTIRTVNKIHTSKIWRISVLSEVQIKSIRNSWKTIVKLNEAEHSRKIWRNCLQMHKTSSDNCELNQIILSLLIFVVSMFHQIRLEPLIITIFIYK